MTLSCELPESIDKGARGFGPASAIQWKWNGISLRKGYCGISGGKYNITAARFELVEGRVFLTKSRIIGTAAPNAMFLQC